MFLAPPGGLLGASNNYLPGQLTPPVIGEIGIFRGLLQLPGIVRRLGPDCVEIVLERPDSDKVANALETLLTELNTQQPRMLASGPILVFRLTDVNISQSPI